MHGDMRLVFLGPPGVGKGTQAKIFSEIFGLPHVSTGEMLREAVASGSSLGQAISEIINRGELVSDDVVAQVLEQRLGREDCLHGFILDGFPRTLRQGELLTAILDRLHVSLNRVFYFSLPTDELLKRLSHRRGSEARADDTVEVQRKRLVVYEEQTLPLVDYYRQQSLLFEVDSSGEIQQVTDRACAALVPQTEDVLV